MTKISWVSILILMGMINLCQGANYLANLNFKFTYQKSYPSDFSEIVKLEQNDMKLIEVYPNNTLIYTNLGGTSHLQKTYFNSTNLNSFYYNQQLIDYSFDWWRYWQIHFLVGNGQIISHYPFYDRQLSRLDVTQFDISVNSVLENTNQTFYIINPTNQTAVINRVFRQGNVNMTLVQKNALDYSLNITDFQIIPNITITSITGDQIRAKVCRRIFGLKEFIAVWNSSTYIEIYECDYFGCILNGTINQNLGNGSWIGQSINFNYECNLLLVQYDAYQYPSIYNTSGYRISFYPVLEQIVDFRPLAYAIQQAALLFKNGSFIVYSVKNNTFMKDYNSFGIPSQFSRFAWDSRRMIINYQDRIDVYKFECWDLMYFYWWRGQCKNCSNTCASCDESNGDCLSCIPGYEINPLNSMQCIPLPLQNSTVIVPPIQPNGSNPINNNTFNNITNMTTNITTDQQTQNSSLNQNYPYKYGAQYYYELKSAQGLIEGFKILGQFIGVLFNALEILPLAWLFLNFMNFWTICSFYVFLDVQIPLYLRLILQIIYDKTNMPIIQTDDIAHRIYSENQKLPSMSDQFGVSSSFIHNNIEGLIIFCISIVIAKTIIFVFSKFNKKSWFFINLSKNLDLKQINASQFISTASGYFLPFMLIIKMSYHSTFKEIINVTLHIFFIGFSLILSFFNFKKETHQKNLKCKNNKMMRQKILQKKEKNKRQIIETLQWIFESNCNTILPLLCVLQQTFIYLVFGVFFFAYGVRLAFYSESLKANNVILACYRLLFHIAFLMVSFFGSFSVVIKNNGSIICAFLLFIGAVHQILTLVFTASSFIITNIRIHCKKNTKVSPLTQIVKQVKQKKTTPTVLINKMKLKVQKIGYNHYPPSQQSKNLQRFFKQVSFKPKKIHDQVSQVSNEKQQISYHNDRNSDSISTEQNSKNIQNNKTYVNPFRKKRRIQSKKLRAKSFVPYKVKISELLQKSSNPKKQRTDHQVLQIYNFD